MTLKKKRLNEIAELLNGYAFKSKKYTTSGIRIIRIANVQDGYIVDNNPCYYPLDTSEEIGKYVLNEGDILLSLTGNVGRVGIISKELLPAALNQRICCLRIKDQEVNKKFLYYYLRQRKFIRECTASSKGVAQLNLSTKWLEEYLIDLPSLEEQIKIVSKIEELFSQLDRSVETLNKVKEQLILYQKSILESIFEGSYNLVPLKTISNVISGYAFKSSKYVTEGQYTVVKIGNVKPFRFDFSRDCTNTNEVDATILHKYLLKNGDCLITLTGSRGKRDYGYVAMVENQTNFLLNQRVAALRFHKEVALPKFYQYYLSTAKFRNTFFSYETGNVGQGNVGIKALTEPKVILPSLAKQGEVVKILDAHLSNYNYLCQFVDKALQQADAMRQSILKKAFEGNL